eukprot:7803221-Ditylum_brightwellii.AAC.1
MAHCQAIYNEELLLRSIYKNIIEYRIGEFTEYTKAAGWLTLYVSKGSVPNLPDNTIQTKATELGPFISSTAESEYIMAHPTQIEENPSTLLEYISTLPEHVRHFMGNLQQQEIYLNYLQAAL